MPAFVVAQLVGGLLAFAAVRLLYPDVGPAAAAEIVVLHEERVLVDDDVRAARP